MFGERLKAARKMAGLSLTQLEKRLGDVSKQSLSNYENGKRKPDSKILVRLSKELKVKPDFFIKESNVEMQKFEYRKKAKLSMQDKGMIEEKSKDMLERYLELEELLRLKSKFINPLKGFKIRGIEDLERAAEHLRDEWELGSNPIKNLIETIEEKEIRVVQIAAKDEFDGLAGYSGNTPVIVVNENMKDIVRKRLTIAHELGHLLLELSDNLTEKEKENYCFRFAGAFLIPKEVMLYELGERRNQITFNELIHLKEEYGISIQGLVRRAKDLGIISESKFTGFCIKVRSIGWERYELGTYNSDERPIRRDNLIYRAITEEIISISKAASLANKTVAELQGEMQVLL